MDISKTKKSKSDLDASDDVHEALLAAVAWIANHHNIEFSPEAALRGLPLSNGQLTLELLEPAFQNLGLSARLVKKSPIHVPQIVCQFLVFFEGGDVGIGVRRDAEGGTALVQGTRRIHEEGGAEEGVET